MADQEQQPLLSRRLINLSVLLGLVVGIGLCPIFGEKWKEAAAEKSDLVEQAPAAQETGSSPDAQETPDSEPDKKDTDLLVPEHLNLGFAEEYSGELVQILDDNRAVVFTVDPNLQSSLTKLLQEYDPPMASVVAIEPSTGRILAMVDHSAMDEGQLRVSLRAEGPAASIFKLVSAQALLETGQVNPGTVVCYSGGKSNLVQRHLEYNPETDKLCKTLAEGMATSANPVFGRLAHQHLHPKALQQVADRFGFNQPIPFLWPVETSLAKISQEPLALARAAAGFQDVNMSPLHGAMIAAAIANRGKMMAPQIVDRVEDAGTIVFKREPRLFGTPIPPEDADKITRMMLGTIEFGTASKYFSKAASWLKGMEIAGKTGSLSARVGSSTLHFSWFVGFAPARNPKVAIAVLVANEPKWRVKSTYVARRAFEVFFQ